MRKVKLMLAFVTLMIFCSLAIAAEQELLKPADGGSVVCENCLTDEICKGKVAAGENLFHCDKTCTIKLKDKDNKEVWSMRLNGACISFSKRGYVEEIRALKDSAENLNINGYLTKMKPNDYIWFEYSVKTISSDISSPKFYIYGSKEKDGSISPFTACSQTFYPRSQPSASEFKVSRPLKKEGKSYGCEINFYQIYNQNDVKKDKDGKPQYKIYYQKCGEISYSANDNELNSLSCEPKLDYTDQAARKVESRMYCSAGNNACKLSSFTISIYGESSGYPLGVQIRGGQYADKTNFKSVVSKKELKSQLPMKVLEADNFAIGSQSFKVKPKDGESSEVKFVEEQLPTMYVPNGVDVEMYTEYGSYLTYKYLPEFSRPIDKKFEGYLFKFNPQKQYPSMVYPVNFDLSQWNMKNMVEAKLFAGSSYHAGLTPKVRFDGGQIQFKGKDGKAVSAYKSIVVEWRVNPNLLDGAAPKKDSVSVKPCTGEGCTSAVTANMQCGPVTTMAEMDYASLSDYVTVKLGYVKPKIPVVAPKPTLPAPTATKPIPTATTPVPAIAKPIGQKRVGGKRGGTGRRAKPAGESEEETVMMESSELTAEQKASVAKFVTMIIKLNEKKMLDRKDATDISKDYEYYAAEVSVTNGGKEEIRVWSQAAKVNEKTADGLKKGDQFKAPSELLYPNKCKGQANVGASKDALSTVGWTKVSAEDAKKWNIECKDNKFIRTADKKEFLPDKEYCLIPAGQTSGSQLFMYKCVNNEPYFKWKACACRANIDGTGQCANAKASTAIGGKSPSNAQISCSPPNYIDSNNKCGIFMCENTAECIQQFGSGYVCDEKLGYVCDKKLVRETSMPAGWVALTSAEITRYQAGCNGDQYKSVDGEFNPSSTYCRIFIKGEGQYQFRCFNSVPAYNFISRCLCENDKCMATAAVTAKKIPAYENYVKCSSDSFCKDIITSSKSRLYIFNYPKCIEGKCREGFWFTNWICDDDGFYDKCNDLRPS